MKKYLHSKWTSLEKLNGWTHFEVKNVFVKNRIRNVSVCEKNILVRVMIEDINNKTKWLPGWKDVV